LTINPALRESPVASGVNRDAGVTGIKFAAVILHSAGPIAIDLRRPAGIA
jgi:hypothetical protein